MFAGEPLSPEAFIERLDLPVSRRDSGLRLPLSADDLSLLRGARETRTLEVPFDGDPGIVRPPAASPERGASPSASRIRGAAAQAVAQLFDGPYGIPRAALGGTVAQTSAQTRGVMGAVRGFNEAIIVQGSRSLDAAGRLLAAPFVGAIAGISQAAQEMGASLTNARRLERDLAGLLVATGVATGAGARGAPGRPPRPDRLLAEADRRGILDRAVHALPPNRQAEAGAQLREAFREGHEAAATAATTGLSTGRAAQGSPAPIVELPAVSRTVNPLTAEEFAKLPNDGLVDPTRVRTLQGGISVKFKPDPVTGETRRVIDTVNDLRSGRLSAHDIEPVRIFEHMGHVFTADHRRVVAFRLAELPVRYIKATRRQVRKALSTKHDKIDDGLSIRIRKGGGR